MTVERLKFNATIEWPSDDCRATVQRRFSNFCYLHWNVEKVVWQSYDDGMTVRRYNEPLVSQQHIVDTISIIPYKLRYSAWASFMSDSFEVSYHSHVIRHLCSHEKFIQHTAQAAQHSTYIQGRNILKRAYIKTRAINSAKWRSIEDTCCSGRTLEPPSDKTSFQSNFLRQMTVYTRQHLTLL